MVQALRGDARVCSTAIAHGMRIIKSVSSGWIAFASCSFATGSFCIMLKTLKTLKTQDKWAFRKTKDIFCWEVRHMLFVRLRQTEAEKSVCSAAGKGSC